MRSDAARAKVCPMLIPLIKTTPPAKLETLHALAVAGLLTALGVGVFPVPAQNAPKTEGEVWTAPARAARKQNTVAVDAKSVNQGKDNFVVGCLACHGPSGKGDGPASASLERNGMPVRPGNLANPKLWEQTDGALFWKISEGRSPMPAFQEVFSEEERWQIVNYVRTLAPREGNQNQEPKRGEKQ